MHLFQFCTVKLSNRQVLELRSWRQSFTEKVSFKEGFEETGSQYYTALEQAGQYYIQQSIRKAGGHLGIREYFHLNPGKG